MDGVNHINVNIVEPLMRAEIEAIVTEIQQAVSLLRRHL
jgi:hypothetical protein